MRYMNLPNSDLSVSSICMGGMAFSDLDNLEQCVKIFDKYVEMGGNVIDTANLYGKWLPAGTNISEIEIGNWMHKRKNRNNLIIGTKGGHPKMETMNIPRVNKKDVGDDLEESLSALQTDYIDIYWMHRDDENRPVEEIIDFLSFYRQEGKIRYFGISNWKLSRVEEVLNYIKQKKLKGFLGCQAMWSLAEPNWENMKDKTLVVMNNHIREFHIKNNLPVFAFSSQARGFFEIINNADGDKQMENGLKNNPGGWLNQDLYKIYYNRINYDRYLRAKKFAEERNLTISQVVLGYIISQKVPAIPIIGSDNVEQLTESMTAGDMYFTEEDIAYLKNG